MYKVLSILLSYPESAWLEHLPELDVYCQTNDKTKRQMLDKLFQYLAANDEISLQENYVQTFDRTPSHSLHLFEHLHGEDRDRGQAMVNLLQEYQKQDFEPNVNELPDYLPLFLEFLSLIDAHEAAQMLGDAIHVINYIGDKLTKKNSVYSAIFNVLVTMSPVIPEELKVAPVRDMDEAMEMFGPTPDGVEPLLNTPKQQVHKMQFYGKKNNSNLR